MSGERRVGKRGEQKRRWDEEHRLPCEICGAPTRTYGRPRPGIRCRLHGSQLERGELRRRRIVELWHEGRSLKEIAADLATTVGTVKVRMAEMRHAGYDLPHRHPTSQSLDLTGEQTLGSAPAPWPSTAGPGGSRGFSTAEGAG